MRVKINKYLLFFVQFVIFLGLFYVLFHSSINMVIFPFAFGMLFALAWANQKVWLLVPAYIAAGVLQQATFESAICLLVTVFCLIVPYFAHVLAKKNMRKWEFFLFAILSQAANVVFEILGGLSPILSLASMLFGGLFMFACMNVFEAIVIRGFTNKLTILELVSLFSIIAAICGGLSVLNVGAFSFLKLFMSLLLLLFAFCASPLLTMLVASIGGLGALIATNNPLFFAPFIIWALAAVLFKKRFRVFMVIALVCVELLIGFYFNLYLSFGIVEILPVLISSLIFLLLPKSVCSEIAVIFNLSKDRLAMKNVVNRNREILSRRLGNLGEVFNEMNIIYRKMLKSSMTIDEVKEVLRQEISDKICSFCPERNHCHRTFADNTKQVFDELITISYEKGKATLLDIPSYLTSRCKQTNAILGSINTLTAQYKKYMSMVHEVDTSKLIIAEQLLGISKIMGGLSKEVECNISFDTARENKILDELTYFNIICIDAVVFEKDVWTMTVSVVVRNEDAEKPRIVDVVSKVCGSKMTISEIFPCSRPGYSVVNLKTAPKYDCLFGVSQKTKTGSKVSGDSYSVTRLDDSRFLFAISDGMGSGEKANNVSDLSIGLVENFYRAGFDNEIILSTVNKLLVLHKQEIFSALDICVVDGKNGVADFIKMASPKSFVLNEDECVVVDSGSLPMGIVEDVKPFVKKNCISEKNFVVLVSDGISDSFETDEELKECVKSIKTKNPQEFADELLERALACNNGYAVDDMTVLVVKII
ncbi:MAG: SpoIIE family protein phosphatase [Clostridia bacterium]|nr:SpoIIE family protein phosphatase [Clostridia bacterium]